MAFRYKLTPDANGYYCLPNGCRIESSTSEPGKFVVVGKDGLYLNHGNETDSRSADITYFDSPIEAAMATGFGPSFHQVVTELSAACQKWLLSVRDPPHGDYFLQLFDDAINCRPWMEYEYLRAEARRD